MGRLTDRVPADVAAAHPDLAQMDPAAVPPAAVPPVQGPTASQPHATTSATSVARYEIALDDDDDMLELDGAVLRMQPSQGLEAPAASRALHWGPSANTLAAPSCGNTVSLAGAVC